MKPDLTLLYSELGLNPNCTLAELQLAYRRRISQLQPNRSGGEQPPEAVAMLRNLIWLYTSATRFHRRYGRLPGAPPRHDGGTIGHPGQTSPQRIPSTPAPYIPVSADAPSRPPRVALWVAIALLVLLFVLVAVASGEWLR